MRGSAAFRAAVAPGGVLAGPWVRNELWRRARAVPSLDLRFAENKSLGDAVTGQSLVTFTRASSGTYVGSDGLIKTASNDIPRFDHDPVTGESLGLLVEESRSNLLLNSATLATQNVTVTAVAHTLSFYGTGTVTLSGAHSATVASTGVYPSRATLTFTPTAGTLTVSVSAPAVDNRVGLVDDWIDWDDAVKYANLEPGSFATSYIPTTSSTVTRAADVASIEGTNFNTAQFSRASTATFYNSSGIITTANVDIPRNNYNPTTLVAEGLLLEPQRENLLLHSEDVDQHTLANVTSSLDATTAPDNATTADELAPTATTAEHYVGYSVSVTAGKTYTFSAYVKPNGATAVRLRFAALAGFSNEGGNHVFATNTTTPGTCNFRIIAIQNGWYRIEGTVIASGTGIGSPRIYPKDENSWLGVPAEALYVWGAQLEEGADATSYIPTTTTEVTRSADVPAVSPWCRQDEGSLYSDFQWTTINARPNAPIFRFDDNTNNNFIQLGTRNVSPSAPGSIAVRTSGGSVLETTTGTVDTNDGVPHRFAGSYQVLNIAFSADGQTAGTTATSGMPVVNTMRISSTNTGIPTNYAIYIRRLVYWPQRLPNTTLQAITQ